MRLHHDGPVWVLDLGDDENRLSPPNLTFLESAIARIGVHDGPAALVTVGSGRFYSNGLDVEWIGEHASELDAHLARVQAVLADLLTLGVPTVAAVNGHAFGAGAMLALAHDHRVMRTERGYVCLPEVDLHLSFADGLARLVTAKLSTPTAFAMMTTGRRYDATAARDAGIVDRTAPIEDLLDAAVQVVEPLIGKDRTTTSAIKRSVFRDAYDALTRPSRGPRGAAGPRDLLSP
ncbi:enoyl-CoA hydratase/carnithine racemase [Nocardioides cavernae]|uniref:Enoyl-CoA hydratase/carnithine racemase n=1 Tax=Nocardioides cavernae TaxID=1921566 RepID=A0A7Y9KQ95_9ACTN|nr:enoyl-CoA hydratase-related protein [Nocardioides cavernae]NYE35350.1 enoyl-CoA hydratase/carnithine racemase [Nocardioides cavernae]